MLKFYKKDEGAIKHDYATKAAIDVRTCYCVKEDYSSKHLTSTHYVGLDQFDIDACTALINSISTPVQIVIERYL